jgi:hypothetical protein
MVVVGTVLPLQGSESPSEASILGLAIPRHLVLHIPLWKRKERGEVRGKEKDSSVLSSFSTLQTNGSF